MSAGGAVTDRPAVAEHWIQVVIMLAIGVESAYWCLREAITVLAGPAPTLDEA